ncbi:hypothetical protein D6C95_10531, partial [Aureobasidium pullulans]
MAVSRSWASFPRRNTDTSTNDEDQSLENLTQQTKPEPQETIRRLTSRETLFMSPSKTWNLYRRNPWYLSWQQETWAMIFSLSCLIAVAVIMAWIDGKRLSIWHWAIQPNAVISVLIVSSKAALMITSFPVIQNFNAMPSWGTGVQLSDRLLKSRLGLMESIYGQTTDPPFDCPASSCSWDSHVTLGLCSRCE